MVSSWIFVLTFASKSLAEPCIQSARCTASCQCGGYDCANEQMCLSGLRVDLLAHGEVGDDAKYCLTETSKAICGKSEWCDTSEGCTELYSCQIQKKTCSETNPCLCTGAPCASSSEVCEGSGMKKIVSLQEGDVAKTVGSSYCIKEGTAPHPYEKCNAGSVCNPKADEGSLCVKPDQNCAKPGTKELAKQTCSAAAACTCDTAVCSRPTQFCADGNLVELTPKNTISRGYAANSIRKYCIGENWVAECKLTERCHPGAIVSGSSRPKCVAESKVVPHGEQMANGKICIGDGMKVKASACRMPKGGPRWCNLYNAGGLCATSDPTACVPSSIPEPVAEPMCAGKQMCFWDGSACKKQTCANSKPTLESSCPPYHRYVTEDMLLVKACMINKTHAPCTVSICCEDDGTSAATDTGNNTSATTTPGGGKSIWDTTAIALTCVFVVLFAVIMGVFVRNIIYAGSRGEAQLGGEKTAKPSGKRGGEGKSNSSSKVLIASPDVSCRNSRLSPNTVAMVKERTAVVALVQSGAKLGVGTSESSNHKRWGKTPRPCSREKRQASESRTRETQRSGTKQRQRSASATPSSSKQMTSMRSR